MKMRELLHRRRIAQSEFMFVGTTLSRSSAWAFDRWRLYYPYFTEIGVLSIYSVGLCTSGNPVMIQREDGYYYVGDKDLIIGLQKFSSSNTDFEHDFTIDLSNIYEPDDDSAFYIVMSRPKSTAEFQQIYCYPTGFSNTRNKNAEIEQWDFSMFGVGENVGGSATSLIFSYQPMTMLNWFNSVTTPKLLAKTIKFDHTSLEPVQIDKLIQWTDAGGVTGGTLDYSSITWTNDNGQVVASNPTSASRQYYDNLISKSWTITGTPPPTS